jgi:hypothetical protein
MYLISIPQCVPRIQSDHPSGVRNPGITLRLISCPLPNQHNNRLHPTPSIPRHNRPILQLILQPEPILLKHPHTSPIIRIRRRLDDPRIHPRDRPLLNHSLDDSRHDAFAVVCRREIIYHLHLATYTYIYAMRKRRGLTTKPPDNSLVANPQRLIPVLSLLPLGTTLLKLVEGVAP